MLSNCEWSATTGVSLDIPVEFAEFAMFTLDMRDTAENGEPLFPALQERFDPQPLWEVSRKPSMYRKRYSKDDKQSVYDGVNTLSPAEQLDKEQKLKSYIERGYPFGGNFDRPMDGKGVE